MNKSYSGFQIVSKKMKKVYAEVAKYAHHGQACVLLGPTGAGKEFLARHYFEHFKTHRGKRKKMFSLNCGNLSPELAHSELFGHVRGAYTGSFGEKAGLFELAKGGVVFLDEIGDLHPNIQALLLRAIEPNICEARRLGSSETYKVDDVHIIGATEKPKESLRESFLDRLNFQVVVPGLDERTEDLPGAVKFFIKQGIQKRNDKEEIIHNLGKQGSFVEYKKMGIGAMDYLINEITEEILPSIYNRNWPGNFRKLRIAIDSAIIQIERIKNSSDFIREFKYYFSESLVRYSQPKGTLQNSEKILIENSKIQNAFYEQLKQALKTVFPSLPIHEKQNIALFLYDNNGKSFSREEFQNYMNFSVRTAQTRLKTLVENNILNKAGTHKLNYTIKDEFAKSYLESTNAFNDISSELTPKNDLTTDVNHDIMQSLINKSSSIFLACDSEKVKNNYVQYIKTTAPANHQFLYFTLNN